MSESVQPKRIEVAYRTENLRTGRISDHRTIINATKVEGFMKRLEDRSAFDIYCRDADA